VKAHYSHSMPFSIANFPKGFMDSMLSLVNLDMQTSLSKITIKENARIMLMKPYTINPVTWMWRNINFNSFLQHSLSKFIKVSEIALVMVLGLIQVEQTFSQVRFMKSKLQNRLIVNLFLVVEFKNQNFFFIDIFPYDDAYIS
jgi:hypothetical protein